MSEDVSKKTKTWADYYPTGNSYRVEARLPSDLYKSFRQYMIDNGHDRVSPALKEIFTNYLENYSKPSNSKC